MPTPANDGPAGTRVSPPAVVSADPDSPASAKIHSPGACDASLTRAFGFLGKRWNGVLLATLMNGSASFSQLRRAVDGISDSVLSERLAALTEAGLVERTVSSGPPVSVAYNLSASGKALTPAMRELATWARGNLPA
ncbi:MAG: ArsR family transcriptional regulator [Glaciihabitans sp.]|nr:ArsR family transcriptional regulator [Glaciihabitans sp.]